MLYCPHYTKTGLHLLHSEILVNIRLKISLIFPCIFVCQWSNKINNNIFDVVTFCMQKYPPPRCWVQDVYHCLGQDQSQRHESQSTGIAIINIIMLGWEMIVASSCLVQKCKIIRFCNSVKKKISILLSHCAEKATHQVILPPVSRWHQIIKMLSLRDGNVPVSRKPNVL